jgi:hypothetical protein
MEKIFERLADAHLRVCEAAWFLSPQSELIHHP